MATVSKKLIEMNILEATKLSMKRVIDKFNLSKANLIIDGNFKLNYKNYSEQSIIKEDQNLYIYCSSINNCKNTP